MRSDSTALGAKLAGAAAGRSRLGAAAVEGAVGAIGRASSAVMREWNSGTVKARTVDLVELSGASSGGFMGVDTWFPGTATAPAAFAVASDPAAAASTPADGAAAAGTAADGGGDGAPSTGFGSPCRGVPPEPARALSPEGTIGEATELPDTAT